MFEIAVVNEPLVFEPLKFYCICNRCDEFERPTKVCLVLRKCKTNVDATSMLFQISLHIRVPYLAVGWSGGTMVLGKFLVPGRPTNLDNSRGSAYCACNWCGWGLFGRWTFFSHL